VNQQDAHAAVCAALTQVAPDVDAGTLDDGARLRQDLELDSLDFLAVVEVIARTTGVDIPESDYAQVATVQGLTAYVAAHS
jgi:acyl carrier protein